MHRHKIGHELFFGPVKYTNHSLIAGRRQPAAIRAEGQSEYHAFMAAQKASDLHLKPMRPPLLRVQGKLVPMKGEPLKPQDLERLLLPLLNRSQKEKFDHLLSVDFGYGVPGVARFRGNMYMQRGTVAAVFRRIPIQAIGIDEMELPLVIHDLTTIPDGLVLVTGNTPEFSRVPNLELEDWA